MPARFRVPLPPCASRSRVLLRLLPGSGIGGRTLLGLLGGGGLLPGGGFGCRALLGLLGRGGLLPGGGFGCRALLGLLGRGSLLSGGSFGGGALLRLPGSSGALLRLLASGGFSRSTLLRSMVRRRWLSHPRFRSRRRMGGRHRRCWPRSRLHRLMNSLGGRDGLLRRCRSRLRGARRWLRPMPCRWQTGEVGRTRRPSYSRRR